MKCSLAKGLKDPHFDFAVLKGRKLTCPDRSCLLFVPEADSSGGGDASVVSTGSGGEVGEPSVPELPLCLRPFISLLKKLPPSSAALKSTKSATQNQTQTGTILWY